MLRRSGGPAGTTEATTAGLGADKGFWIRLGKQEESPGSGRRTLKLLWKAYRS